ncbi:MAG: PAS domain-containing protein, partial [Terriglobia bacterium]
MERVRERPLEQSHEKLNSHSGLPEDVCLQSCRVVCVDEALFSVDSQGLLNSFNPGAQVLLGYTATQILGRPFGDLLNEGEKEAQRILAGTKGGPGVHHFETFLRGREGREIPVRLSVSTVSSNFGESVGMIFLCHDLTKIRELETAIQEKEQFFASILRNSADAIFTLDAREHITSWNKGAEAIFGYTEEEMLGRSLDILLPPYLKEKKELEEISRVSRREGYLRSYQTQRLTKDGQLIDVIFTRTTLK